jgi:hypothetical protein
MFDVGRSMFDVHPPPSHIKSEDNTDLNVPI